MLAAVLPVAQLGELAGVLAQVRKLLLLFLLVVVLGRDLLVFGARVLRRVLDLGVGALPRLLRAALAPAVLVEVLVLLQLLLLLLLLLEHHWVHLTAVAAVGHHPHLLVVGAALPAAHLRLEHAHHLGLHLLVPGGIAHGLAAVGVEHLAHGV